MAVTVSSTSSAPPPVKSKPTSVAAAKSSAATAARTAALEGIGQLIQLPLIITRQHADAGAVGLHWPSVAQETAKLAETQPKVAQVVDLLLRVGPYAGIIAAVLPFAVQIGVNHGRVAPGAMGSVPAVTLESQVQASIAQAELQGLRIQQEAQQEAARIRAEIQRSREELANAA